MDATVTYYLSFCRSFCPVKEQCIPKPFGLQAIASSGQYTVSNLFSTTVQSTTGVIQLHKNNGSVSRKYLSLLLSSPQLYSKHIRTFRRVLHRIIIYLRQSVKGKGDVEHQIYRKGSMLISRVLTGFLRSYFSRTVGCKIPKEPTTMSLLPMRRWTEAAWPGKYVGSRRNLLARCS